MHLQLDVEGMRGAMAMWRHEVAAEPRADSLARLSATLGGWLDLLRLCTPGPDDVGQLRAIAAEAEQLREWADEARAALRLIEQAPGVR